MDNNYDGPSTLANSAGLGAVKARESEMTRVLTKLHQVVEIAHKSFSELDSKLTPILRGPMPESAKEGATPGYSSALASDINVACEKVENLIRYIQSVRSRVEL